MSAEPNSADALVVHISQLATPVGREPHAGASMASLRIVDDAAIAIRGEQIVAVGPRAEIEAQFDAPLNVDAGGGVVIPGFVDAHTHPVFFGTRENEFEMRTRGATYVEIAKAGGGILSSVKGVRAASEEQLIAALIVRLDRFLELGTTTVEAKSGYGLSLEDELKCLRVIRQANELHPIELVPTFLGAHAFPEEFRDDRSSYVDLLIEEMLPAVADAGLAEYCDIFTESHAFDLEQSRRVMTSALGLGLELRMHVDQLTPLGGASLAAELGAKTADHLEYVDDAGIEAMAEAGVLPVLLPLVPLYLRSGQEAPGRVMIDRGLALALATDFNPGSCYVQSMPEVLSWAALRYSMTVEETLTGATLNAACSLGRGDRVGTIESGKEADLAILDLPNLRHLTYELGRNPVAGVIKGGQVVYEREELVHERE